MSKSSTYIILFLSFLNGIDGFAAAVVAATTVLPRAEICRNSMSAFPQAGFVFGANQIEPLFYYPRLLEGGDKNQIKRARAEAISRYADLLPSSLNKNPLQKIGKNQNVKIQSVFPDYDHEKEIIIHLGNDWHVSLVVGSTVFHGEAFFERSRPPEENVTALSSGIFLRFKGIERGDLVRLKQAIRSQTVLDLDCFSSIVQLLETNTDLRLVHKNQGGSFLPTETLILILNGRLRDSKNVSYLPEIKSFGSYSLAKYIKAFSQIEVMGAEAMFKMVIEGDESTNVLERLWLKTFNRPMTEPDFNKLKLQFE